MIDREVGKKDGRRNLKLIIYRDVYKIMDLPQNCFDYIFDIGAHIGLFSVTMRFRHPLTKKIIAVEPAKEQLMLLEKNIDMLDIETIPLALGDGNGPLYLWQRGKRISEDVFTKRVQADSYLVNTITLSEIVYNSGCVIEKDKYMLKFDCEGGEKYAIEDRNAISIFKNAEQISMEIHFRGNRAQIEEWENFPFYNDWIHEHLEETHDIDYYISNRSGGWGHYCIRKKGFV